MNLDEQTTPASTAAPDRPLPSVPAAFWIGWYSFREMVRRRRLFFLGLIALIPAVLAVSWRLIPHEGYPALSLLYDLGGVLYIHFLVALVAMTVGLSAIGEQVAEGTILYYWTRPLSRAAIYLGRLVAAQMVASVLLLGSVILCFLVIAAGNTGVVSVQFLKVYVCTGFVLCLGAGIYTAIFAAIGTVLRRPLLVAILYAFGWESISGTIPLRIQELTVVFHLRNLIPVSHERVTDLQSAFLEMMRHLLKQAPVSPGQSFLTLLGVLIVFIALGIWLLRRKEIFK